jgi:glycosyltransferase involved in cell wall biosynthesis
MGSTLALGEEAMTTPTVGPRPLRVAHVTFGLDVGGLEMLLLEFARHVDRRALDLNYVSLGTRGVLGPQIEKYSWSVTALEAPRRLCPILVPRLAALFRGRRVDVVHTHNTKALVYGGPAARLARVPLLVHTWHGQNLVGSPREALLFRAAGRLADRVVAVSNDAAAFMAYQGIPSFKMRTIYNGIDAERFCYCGPREKGPVVTVARLSPEKDVACLIRAAALIRQAHRDFQLEIAGDGVCRGDLCQLTAQLGLENNVRFLGQVDDVPALLERCSLFVLPSQTEGISLTLLEAMARGLPVVATRVGGNPEVVDEDKTGLLTPPGQPEELATAILRLMREPALGRVMGQAGRQRVEMQFNVHAMVAAYERLYREGQRRSIFSTRPPGRPSLASNLPALSRPPASAVVRNAVVAPKGYSLLNALRFWLESSWTEAILINQNHALLFTMCALRGLFPLPRPPLISCDLVLSKPGKSFASRLKASLKRWLFSQVDLFLLHMKDSRAWRDLYGIPNSKRHYVPMKVNFLEEVLRHDVREEPYVFTGGKSRRDYKTFCQAMALAGYPALILTPHAAENSEHGTTLGGLNPPANVAIVHDDGSADSWLSRIARAKLVVFCISPETISPSGVGAYLVAMALKKCVIISDCPATRGILIPDETAILVPMEDPVALAEAIRKAWFDSDYRYHVAEGGHRYAMALGGEEVLMANIARQIVHLLEIKAQANISRLRLSGSL